MSKWVKKVNIILTAKWKELLIVLLNCTPFPCPPLYTIKNYKLYAFTMFCFLKEYSITRSSVQTVIYM